MGQEFMNTFENQTLDTKDLKNKYSVGDVIAQGVGHYPAVSNKIIRWVAVKTSSLGWKIYWEEDSFTVTFHTLKMHGTKVVPSNLVYSFVRFAPYVIGFYNQ